MGKPISKLNLDVLVFAFCVSNRFADVAADQNQAVLREHRLHRPRDILRAGVAVFVEVVFSGLLNCADVRHRSRKRRDKFSDRLTLSVVVFHVSNI